jgi:hypothetical protein
MVLHSRFRDYLEFALPAAVLVMEVYVIFLMTRESKERSETIETLQEITSRSRRVEYLLDIAQSVQKTEAEAFFTTASMEVSTRSVGQKEILDAVMAREQRGAYEHRGLIARQRTALPGAIELMMRTQVEAKMSDVVAFSRLRFFVRDRVETILGVAEGQPDLADPKKTTQSTRIRSRMLAEALEGHFEVLWAKSIEVGAYLDELITSSMPVTRAEVHSWLSAIDCSEKELEDFLLARSGSVLYSTLPESNSQKQGS